MTPAELRHAREARRMTQEAFATAMGVCARTISRWETIGPVPRWVAFVLSRTEKPAA